MNKIDFLLKPLIAHRGYFNNKNIPENSISAFKKAIRYGYSIELDVHLTKDEKVVVFHDFNLKRMCGVNKRIEDCTYDELLKYNLLDTKYKIPLFSEVLNLINGKVPLLIETKVEKSGRLEQIMSDMLDNYNGNFAIQSFNPFSIYWFKKHRKYYVRGILSGDFKHNKTMSSLRKNILKSLVVDIILKVDFISYDIRALPNSRIEKKRKYKTIIGWTVNDKKEYLFAKKYCDNMICENMNEYIN